MLDPSSRPRLALVVLLVLSGALASAALHLGAPTLHDERLSLVDAYATLPAGPMPALPSSEIPDAPGDDARQRQAWDVLRLRDPSTGVIPENIRAREVAFAATLPTREEMLGKNSGIDALSWTGRGPYNVGGRTRALGIDRNYNGTTNRRILAGGVSGGMFLSEDDGATWALTSSREEFASTTALAQDPNNAQIWYHGTGEFLGNSARGGGASYYGQGLFKSTDGGRSWTRLPSPEANNDKQRFDSFHDFVWNVAVHPQGSVVLAATYGSVWRSTNGGTSWTRVLGRTQSPYSSSTDIAIAADGTVYATVSRDGNTSGIGQSEYGIFRSTDTGATWTQINPPQLVAAPFRMVLGTAPSNAGTFYVLVQANQEGDKASDHQLFRFSGGTWTNLSSGLPNVTQPDGQNQPAVSNASFSTQGGYDMLVKVKPDNPNVVWIGGTVLYRSADGGQTWSRVGGYSSPYNYNQFENHHSDQHSMAFFPNNANALISGHDGGLSKTTNAMQSPQTWTTLNNGYVSSQFYAIAIDPQGGNDYILGGLQDNGTWLATSATPANDWILRFGGDGAYTAIAPGLAALYVSSQNGNLIRIRPAGNQLAYSNISPANASGYLFIAPYLLDSNDGRVMYVAAGNTVWRNSNLDAIPDNNFQPTSTNWTQLTNSAVGTATTHQVTALAVSKTPANRLYFGATNYNNETKIMRVDNPAGNGTSVDITPAVPGGSYPSNITINPNNADEVMVVFSNYRISSVWHTTNGGQSWTEIEGNLSGDNGPSVRWGMIQPVGGTTHYMLATSTGVYATNALAGANTVWAQEGATTIGNVVTTMLASRDDGTVVAATHGRGVYSAKLTGGGPQAVAATSRSRIDLGVKPGTSRSTTIAVNNTGGAPLNFTAQTTCSSGKGGPGGTDGLSSFITAPRRVAGVAPAGTMTSARAVQAPQNSSSKGGATLPGTILSLDDGNETPETFVGDPEAGFFTWRSRFDLAADFTLEEVQWFMRTESNTFNSVGVTVYSQGNVILASGTLSVAASAAGQWYSATLNEPIVFKAGAAFFIEIDSPIGINFPAGTDKNGKVPGKSFSYDYDLGQYVSLATLQGFENGAWLIRASGTGSTTTENQAPQAVARVSTPTAKVGEAISFDATGSNDPDGQVVAYRWSFGDGQTSTQAVTSHSYAAPGTYTISLEVTDDKGAKGSVSGQLTITSGTPCALTVTPASGTVAAGGAQTLTVTFDATGLAQGNYGGTLTIGGNGGTVAVPVAVEVSTTVAADAPSGPEAVTLGSNQPNPFRTSTDIPYTLRQSSTVRLTVYDALGRTVRILEEGARPAGAHTARWDGTLPTGAAAPAGLYLYALSVDEGGQSRVVRTGRMMLVR